MYTDLNKSERDCCSEVENHVTHSYINTQTAFDINICFSGAFLILHTQRGQSVSPNPVPFRMLACRNIHKVVVFFLITMYFNACVSRSCHSQAR